MQVDTFESWAQLGNTLYEFDSPEVCDNEDVRPNNTSWEASREKQCKVLQ